MVHLSIETRLVSWHWAGKIAVADRICKNENNAEPDYVFELSERGRHRSYDHLWSRMRSATRKEADRRAKNAQNFLHVFNTGMLPRQRALEQYRERARVGRRMSSARTEAHVTQARGKSRTQTGRGRDMAGARAGWRCQKPYVSSLISAISSVLSYDRRGRGLCPKLCPPMNALEQTHVMTPLRVPHSHPSRAVFRLNGLRRTLRPKLRQYQIVAKRAYQ